MKPKNTLHKTEPLKWDNFMRFVEKLQDEIREEGRATTARMAMGCVLAAYTGLRFNEMTALHWIDLMQDEKQVKIKGGEYRTVQMAGFVRAFAEFCYENSGVARRDLVLSNKDGAPMSMFFFNRSLGLMMDRHNQTTANPSSQMLRKTYALRVFEVNNNSWESLRELGRVLKHGNISLTLAFIGKDVDDLIKADTYFE